MFLTIKIIPRSSRNEIKEMPNGDWRIKLTAPPVDGKANEALIELLAEHFDVSKSKIKIVRGPTSKNKIVDIDK